MNATSKVFQIVRTDLRIFRLAKPITIDIKFEDGLWVYEHKSLGIIAYDKKREKAFAMFKEEFDYLWVEYAIEEDENLTLDALKLKQQLLGLIENVEAAK